MMATGEAITAFAPAARPIGPLAKARLAGEIIAAYARARIALRRRRELPKVVERLRASSAPRRARRPLPDTGLYGARLGAATVKTLDPLPVDSRCLMRSLVLLQLLAHRGATGSLIITVRPSSDRTPFEAHAWVELDGRPLLPPAAEDHGHLLTL